MNQKPSQLQQLFSSYPFILPRIFSRFSIISDKSAFKNSHKRVWRCGTITQPNVKPATTTTS
jgi:hypothetical protein